MKLLISEVLQKVSNAKTKAEKITLLRQYNTPALRSILIANFDESIVSMLPQGEVPFIPNDAPAGTEHTSDSLQQSKRESLFIQMLEGLQEEEANVLILIKDKTLGKKYKITRACVEEAFPQIQWGNRS